jgi:archaellum component FlaC
MLKRLVLISMIFLLLLSGCAPAATMAPAQPQAAPAERDFSAPASEGFLSGRGADSNKAASSQSSTGSQSEPGANRLVIRNANLTIIVEDPATALTAVTGMAEGMGGFVVTSNLYKTTSRSGQEYPEANITVRVPAEKLNNALAQIKALVKDPTKDIESENVSGQDVTKEYTDLQSQLTNLENTEAQLREIMASATKTEDVLAVYNQLTQVREQIEVIKGQIQYYKESAAMSAIAVQIKALASIQPLEIGGWRPAGVARDAAQALIDTLQFLGSAAIWLIIFFVPVGLVIFLPLRLLWWLIRRNRKPKQQAPASQPPSPPAPQNPA